MSLVSVELCARCCCGGSCVISIKCRSRGWRSSLGLYWMHLMCVNREQRVVGNGTTARRPGSGLPPLCQIRAAKPGQTALVGAERGQRHPDMLLCGLVLLLLRIGFGQCHKRRRDAIPGLRRAGPLLPLTPPATAPSGAGTKFLAPRVAARSLCPSSLCVANFA